MINDSTALLKRSGRWRSGLAQRRETVAKTPLLSVEGQLSRMVGLTLEAEGCVAPVGARCLVGNAGHSQIEAEVVGFGNDKLYLMPSGDVHGLLPASRVVPTGGVAQVPVGEGLLGRVLAGAGRMLDGKPMPRRGVRTAVDVGAVCR